MIVCRLRWISPQTAHNLELSAKQALAATDNSKKPDGCGVETSVPDNSLHASVRYLVGVAEQSVARLRRLQLELGRGLG